MKIPVKIEYARQQIEGIARHDPEPLEVREAALQHIVALVVSETLAMHQRHDVTLAVKIAALTPLERA